MQEGNNKINQQEQKENIKAFYDRLQEELKKNTDWPTQYMYKFIVPNRDENVEKIEKRFENQEITLKKNYSKTGKYVSVTILTRENNPEAVINRYKAMEDIDGLVAL
jgi:putative lipoic acid-binding regulatory protein